MVEYTKLVQQGLPGHHPENGLLELEYIKHIQYSKVYKDITLTTGPGSRLNQTCTVQQGLLGHLPDSGVWEEENIKLVQQGLQENHTVNGSLIEGTRAISTLSILPCFAHPRLFVPVINLSTDFSSLKKSP